LVNRLPKQHGDGDSVQLPKEARESASVAAMTAAIFNGASIVRVHAVRAAVDAAQVADSVLNSVAASTGA